MAFVVAFLVYGGSYLSQLSGHIKNQLLNQSSSSTSQASVGTVDLDFVSLRKPPRDTQATGWISGFGLGGQAQGDGNANGFQYGTGGT